MGKKTKGFIAISEGILRSNKRVYEALARGSNDKSSTKSNKKKYRNAVETFDNPIPENNDDGFIEEEPCYFEEDIETYPSRVETSKRMVEILLTWHVKQKFVTKWLKFLNFCLVLVCFTLKC